MATHIYDEYCEHEGKKQGGTHDSDSLEEYGKTWTFAKKQERPIFNLCTSDTV